MMIVDDPLTNYYDLYKKYKAKYKTEYKSIRNQEIQKGGGSIKKKTPKSHSEIFSKIYDKRIWAPNKKTPLSGAGSTKKYNLEYIDFLENFIHNKKNNIKSILDLGCGDWSFTRDIDFSGKKYLGIDCVSSVIQKNKNQFETNSVKFKKADFSDTRVLSQYLDYDLFIMKDVLQHWSDEDITRVLDFLTQNKRKPK